jgi:hypothetical protein
VWRRADNRDTNRFKVLVDLYVEKMISLRKDLSAAPVVWKSDEQEEAAYIGTLEDADAAREAFRQFKAKYLRGDRIDPAVAVVTPYPHDAEGCGDRQRTAQAPILW